MFVGVTVTWMVAVTMPKYTAPGGSVVPLTVLGVGLPERRLEPLAKDSVEAWFYSQWFLIPSLSPSSAIILVLVKRYIKPRHLGGCQGRV